MENYHVNKQHSDTIPAQMSYRKSRMIKKDPVGSYAQIERGLTNLIIENINHGAMLHEEVFHPEYMGFERKEIKDDDSGDFDFFTREGGVSLMRHPEEDGVWFLGVKIGAPMVEVRIPNTYVAITVFESHGIDVSIERYIRGEWFH